MFLKISHKQNKPFWSKKVFFWNSTRWENKQLFSSLNFEKIDANIMIIVAYDFYAPTRRMRPKKIISQQSANVMNGQKYLSIHDVLRISIFRPFPTYLIQIVQKCSDAKHATLWGIRCTFRRLQLRTMNSMKKMKEQKKGNNIYRNFLSWIEGV